MWAAASPLQFERLKGLGVRRTVSVVATWNSNVRPLERSIREHHTVGLIGYFHLGVTRLYFTRGKVRMKPPDGFYVDV